MKTLNAVILAVAIAVLAFAAYNYLTSQSSTTLSQLASVEIRNYNGTNLSSILTFRENSIKGPQYIANSTYRLTVKGLVSNPESFTYQEVLAFNHYQKAVTLHCVEGWDVTILWEGVLIKDLLQHAGLNGSGNTVIKGL